MHLFPDDAGAVVHDMAERLILPVNVAHEMFSALGQAELGADAGDFRAQSFNGGVLFPQKTQIFQRCGRRLSFHLAASFCVRGRPHAVFPTE